MIWKQLGNSLTTAHVLAEISRGWLKNGVQRLPGCSYLQNTIYRNTFCTIFRNKFTLFILLPIPGYYCVISLQILHCIETNQFHFNRTSLQPNYIKISQVKAITYRNGTHYTRLSCVCRLRKKTNGFYWTYKKTNLYDHYTKYNERHNVGTDTSTRTSLSLCIHLCIYE